MIPIVLTSTAIGALLGFRRAHQRGGNRLDKLQYTFIFALAFFIVGVFISIGLGRVE